MKRSSVKVLVKKILTAIVIIFIICGQSLPVFASEGDTYDMLHPERESSFLGAAQYFALFANHAAITTTFNGNIAVGSLSAWSTIDQNGNRDPALLADRNENYIQSLSEDFSGSNINIGGGNETASLYLGSGVAYEPSDGQQKIAGNIVDGIGKGQIYKDVEGAPFIDFEAEFVRLRDINSQLAVRAESPDLTVTAENLDPNTPVIDVTDINKSTVIVKIEKSVLEMDHYIDIKGLEGVQTNDAGESQVTKQVFFVVDNAGTGDLDVRAGFHLFYVSRDEDGNLITDGNSQVVQTQRNVTEEQDFTNSTILWSFGDGDADQVKTITFNKEWSGTILAPYAAMRGQSQFEGSIIVDSYEASATSFRWDYSGTAPTEPEEEDGSAVLQAVKFDKETGEALIGVTSTDNDTQEEIPITDNMMFLVQKDGEDEAVTLDVTNGWQITLTPGDYAIWEAQSPLGYATDTTQYSFSVAEDGTFFGEAVLSAPPDTPDVSDGLEGEDALFVDADGRLIFWKYDIKESKSLGIPLPHTGGGGTLTFYLTGVFLIGAAVLIRTRVSIRDKGE